MSFHPFLPLFIHPSVRSLPHLSALPILLKNEDNDRVCPTGMACGLPPGERRSSQLCSSALPKTGASGGQANLADGAGNKASASSLHSEKQRHYFANKGPSSQSYGFPVVMYGCESRAIKKAEHRRIDAFGVGKDFGESLGLQGDPTSPS